MRYTGIQVLAISAALLHIGCESNAPSKLETKAKAENASEKIADAVEATGEAATAKRDEYAAEMGKRLDELTLKYERLQEGVGKAKGDAKVALQKKLDEAKVKRDAAAEKLDELKEASADRWEKVKDGVSGALDELKKVIE